MKPYVELECENLGIIQSKVFNYLVTNNILDDSQSGWIFIDSMKLLSAIPELVNYFAKFKLYVRNTAITLARTSQDLSIHLDTLPVVAKINFPILNTDGWANRWYEVEQSILDQCPLIKDKFGNDVEDLSLIPEKEFKLTAELLDMKKPIVFNSRIPHEVVKIADVVGPRIVASFTFHNEPLGLLK
jgi:hypothetical protein